MERLSQLEPRTSVLEDDFDEEALEAEGKAAAAAAVTARPCPHQLRRAPHSGLGVSAGRPAAAGGGGAGGGDGGGGRAGAAPAQPQPQRRAAEAGALAAVALAGQARARAIAQPRRACPAGVDMGSRSAAPLTARRGRGACRRRVRRAPTAA